MQPKVKEVVKNITFGIMSAIILFTIFGVIIKYGKYLSHYSPLFK